MGGTDYFVTPVEHFYRGEDADGKRIERNDLLDSS